MDQHYAIVIVPEAHGAIRRFRLQRRTLQLGAAALAVAILVVVGSGVAVTADWLHLRGAAAEVLSLRAETRAQAEMFSALSEQIAAAELEVERLTEFERKVRIIANLTAGVAEGEDAGREARGGPEDEVDADGADAKPGARTGSRSLGKTGASWRAVGSAPRLRSHGRPAATRVQAESAIRDSGLRERISALLRRVRIRHATLVDLHGALQSKRAELAATPSIWPTEGWLTSGYGERLSPFTGKPQFHQGIDIAASFGTPIVASAKGRVVFSGMRGSLGTTVIVDHGKGIRTWYGHLAESRVAVGRRVRRGAVIGTVGSSGRSTGPHLHYAVEREGRMVDPGDYVFD